MIGWFNHPLHTEPVADPCGSVIEQASGDPMTSTVTFPTEIDLSPTQTDTPDGCSGGGQTRKYPERLDRQP